MVSFMTLQNSMDERKLKNYQAFDHTLFYDWPCVCVVSSEWSGWGLGVGAVS